MFISGAILGVLVGCFTLLVLKFSSLTMDELKEWQSQSQLERDLYVLIYKLLIIIINL